MGEWQEKVLDGSWIPQGHDDILSRALGRKEHGGSVRGVGGGAKIKEVFGAGKSKRSGVISVDELATITQEITKKVQNDCDEKMNEMMNLKLQGIFDHLKKMGVPLPDDSFVHDVSTPKNDLVRSSCQSVDRQENFSNLKIPTLCRLWVIHPDKGKVIVARGTVFPSSSQGKFQLTPLPVPCDEHETVGDVAGSFVQWPKDLVTLGQDPISAEKKKGHEVTTKKDGRTPKKVESKGSVTPIKKNELFLRDDMYSTENC